MFTGGGYQNRPSTDKEGRGDLNLSNFVVI